MPYIPILLTTLCIVGATYRLILSLRDITRHRTDLEQAAKQLAMYLALHSRARDGSEKTRTQEQVDISNTIYRNVVHAYNLCLTKPPNMILSRIMGYHPIIEKEEF